MFRNYFKIAFRNLWKERTFTALNIVGLTAAFCVAFLLCMFTVFELSYDKFHENSDSIYQIYTDSETPQGKESSISNPIPFASAIENEVLGIECITRYLTAGSSIVIGDKSFNASAIWADPEFFEIFSFPVVSGSNNNLLTDKSTAVITQLSAQRYFGDENPVGKTFLLQQDGEQIPITVSAVVDDLPDNSSIGFDIVFNFTKLPARTYADKIDRWDAHNHEVFVQLKQGIDPAQFEKSTAAFSNLHFANEISNAKRDGAQPNDNGDYRQIKLLPLTDINFTSVDNGILQVDRTMQYLILGIALLIIFIASVNFINMSIGK